MLEDTMNDMDDVTELAETDTPVDDSGALTKDQVLELASMQPLLVYEQAEDGKVKVAVLEGVRTFHHPTETGKAPRLSIRIQGIRKGELTYNAKRTIDELSLVPVLALMDAKLVDRMRVSPEALALGKAAIDSLNPSPFINPLVDLLVTEYEESAPIEREFFLPTEEGDDDTAPTTVTTPNMPTVEQVMSVLDTMEPAMGLIDDIDPGFYADTDSLVGNDPGFMQPVSYGDPTSSPNFTGTITFGGYVQEQPVVNTQELRTVEQVIPEPALIEDGEGTVHVSDNLDASAYQSPEALSVHPDRSPSSDLVDTAVEPMAVPGEGAVAYSIDPMGLPVIALEPGVQEDGTLVPFDETVHELPM